MKKSNNFNIDFNTMPKKQKFIVITAAIGIIASLGNLRGPIFLILIGFLLIIALELFSSKINIEPKLAGNITKYTSAIIAGLWIINILRISGYIGFSYAVRGFGFYLLTASSLALPLFYFDIIKLEK